METKDVIKFLTERKMLLREYLDVLEIPNDLDQALSIADRMDRITAVIADLKLSDDELS